MDVLIPLGHGSRHKDLELRYALRSIAEHLSGVRHVYVVGHNPGFLGGDAKHVQLADFDANKESRIALKVLWACGNIPGLSEEFLFSNDDIFLLKPAAVESYPSYHKGELLKSAQPEARGTYQRSLRDTYEALVQSGVAAPLHYDIHVPIRYRRDRFRELEPWWRRSEQRQVGFVVKSVYANLNGAAGERAQDLKINRPHGAEQVRRAIAGRIAFSVSDGAVRPGVDTVLAELFPSPSRFERR